MGIGFEECVRRGKIRRFSRGPFLAPKEIETAASDLKRAQRTFKEGDFKWATIQVYFAMFHAGRAMIYARKYREQSHSCLVEALRSLFVDKGLLAGEILEGFREAKALREEADYFNRWSKTGCEHLLDLGRRFIEISRKFVIPMKN